MVWPVRKAASALARKLTAPTRSSGVSSRWMARDIRVISPLAHVLGILRYGFGEREARGQGVDGDGVLAELACEAARHRNHRALAGNVVQEQGHALERGAGGEVDDAAVAAGAHMRRAGAAAQEHAERIDVHDPAPFSSIDFFKFLQHQGAEERRVVDQDVDAPESLHRFGCHARDVDFRRYVHLQAERSCPRGPRNVCGGGFKILDVGNDDGSAVLREARGERLADAAAGAGDDRHLALQPVHTTSEYATGFDSRPRSRAN